MQCVILAGGLGTRLGSLGLNLPKALIPVDETPFAELQLELLASNGITHVVYSVGHRAAQIQAFVGSGARWGLSVRYVDEGDKRLGTAGALRFALDSGALAESFFVLYGDSYLPLDYRSVWQAFSSSGRAALMTVFRNRGQWDTSNVLFRDGLVELYDKRHLDPRSKRMDFIDYGLSCLSRRIIESRVPSNAVADLAELFNALSLTGELAGLEVFQRFYEVGTPAGLADLESYIRSVRRGRTALKGVDDRR